MPISDEKERVADAGGTSTGIMNFVVPRDLPNRLAVAVAVRRRRVIAVSRLRGEAADVPTLWR